VSDRANNPFMKSPGENFDKAMREATSSSDLREEMDRLLARQGVITRGQSGVFDSTSAAERSTQPSSPDAATFSAPAGMARCYRVIYPSGNNRFELYGNTEQELDDQETKTRATYPTKQS
jgi:hypothetical protein